MQELPRGLITSAGLSLLLVGALAASWLHAVHAYTPTSPRTIPAPQNRTGNPRFQERDETHYLLRGGMLLVYEAHVATALGFNHPDSDKNSRNMARSVVDGSGLSPWTTFRITTDPRVIGPRIAVPLWLPAGASFLLTGLLVRRHRRRTRPGHCACGYALEGLAAGSPCPECGR